MANIVKPKKEEEIEYTTLERKIIPIWAGVDGEVIEGRLAEIGKVMFRDQENKTEREMPQYKVDLRRGGTFSIISQGKVIPHEFEPGDIITLPAAADLINQLSGNDVPEGAFLRVEFEGERKTGYNTMQKLFKVGVFIPSNK